jgi:hypothetical protein
LIPAIIVILIVYAISINNIAVRKQNEVEKAFGSVDAMLKKHETYANMFHAS